MTSRRIVIGSNMDTLLPQVTRASTRDLNTKLTSTEIETLKNSWFGVLTPQFPEDIIGRQYENISDALRTDLFWSQIPFVLDQNELELLTETELLGYHETTEFTKILIIAMVSVDNLEGLDSYLSHWGLTELRIYNTTYESLQLLKLITIELLKCSFVDAFDMQLQHCWTKLLDILIANITKFQDVKFRHAEFIYLNEDALLTTVNLSRNNDGEYFPSRQVFDDPKPRIKPKTVTSATPAAEKLRPISTRRATEHTARPRVKEENVSTKNNSSTLKRFKHSILGVRLFSV